MKNLMTFIVSTAFVCLAFVQLEDCPSIRRSMESKDGFYLSEQIINEEINASSWWGESPYTRKINEDVVFMGCTFNEDFIFQNKKGGRWRFTGDVHFINCTFQGACILSDAIIEGRLIIKDCTFLTQLNLSRTRVIGKGQIEDNRFGNDMDLSYAFFDHDLMTFNNEVGRHALMQGLTVRGDVQLSNLSCIGLDLSKGHFHQECNVNYLQFQGKVLMTSMRCHEDLTMIDAQGAGTIDMTGTRVLGTRTFSEKTEKLLQQ